MLRLTTIAIALLSSVAHASADMVEKTGRFGGMPVTYTVEKNQAHRLRAQEINLSARLFDEIESCK